MLLASRRHYSLSLAQQEPAINLRALYGLAAAAHALALADAPSPSPSPQPAGGQHR